MLICLAEANGWVSLRCYDCGMVNSLSSKEDLLNRWWQYTKCYQFSFGTTWISFKTS